MKKILSLVALAVLAVLGMGAAATYVETGSISYPSKLDAPANYHSYSFYPTNASGSYSWLPAAATNSGQILLTNVVIPIERDQAIGVTFTVGEYGGLYTPSGSNNIAVYGNVSYDGGRTFTTTRPISGTFTYSGSNVAFRPTFFIPYTNLAGGQLFQLSTFSNSAPAGGSNHVFLVASNVTLTTRIPSPR